VVGAEKAELTTQEIQPEANQPVSLEPEETAQEVSQEASEDLTRRIFKVARELGIDNKALGRLARTYFGTSFVRDLNDDQKTRLLAHLEQRLAAKRQEDKRQPTQDDGAVIEFLTSWRQARGSDESFDFEAELAEIAVKNNWLPDELEAAVSEKLLDRSFDFSQLPDDHYWLAAVPKELLSEIVAELRGEQS
jgi:ribosomal protein L32E